MHASNRTQQRGPLAQLGERLHGMEEVHQVTNIAAEVRGFLCIIACASAS